MRKLFILLALITLGASAQQIYPFDMQVDGDLQVDSLLILPYTQSKTHSDTGLIISSDTIYQRIMATNSHAATHITSGSDEVDGDKLDIDFTPSYYTPSTTPSEASSLDNLTAHLYGIDQELIGGTAGYGEWAFQDKGVGLTITASGTWYHMTNATNDLYTEGDTLGVYMSGDTIYFRYAGKYSASMNAGYGGNNDEITGIRLWGERDSTYAGSVYTSGDIVHSTSLGILNLSTDDWIVPQIRNATDTDNITLRTSSIIINRITQ